MDRTEDYISALVKEIRDTYVDRKGINHIEGLNLPNYGVIEEITLLFQKIFFPGFFEKEAVTWTSIDYYVGDLLNKIRHHLAAQVAKALKYAGAGGDIDGESIKITDDVLLTIPKIRNYLKEDVNAALEGDPAAKSYDEIILAYPFIEAISIHRIAHELYARNVPLIPRLMNEIAHRRTGIDIHPGANIGRHFFIDHGTGVVIGETTIIGDNVRIYQNVTLGGLTPSSEERNVRRHPTIEDEVTIFAGATILGNVTIGRSSIIGGNVWLTHSVPPYTKVFTKPKLEYREIEKK